MGLKEGKGGEVDHLCSFPVLDMMPDSPPLIAFLQFCSRQSGNLEVLLHFLAEYHNKMESLPKGWQGVRYDLYANDSTGGRVGAKHPCQFELQKHQFAEGSRRSQCNHFTLYSTDSRVTKK